MDGSKRQRPSAQKYDGELYDYCLDHASKIAVLKVSPAVVRVDCMKANGEYLVSCNGVIVSCEKDADTGLWAALVLTSAACTVGLHVDNMKVAVCGAGGLDVPGEVEAFDVHYDILLVKLLLEASIPVAILRDISIEESAPHLALRRNSTAFHIHPGDKVFAVGRICDARASLFAIGGEFRTKPGELDCYELLTSTCPARPVQVGGPLINGDGEVIGINFYSHRQFTPFLPSNIVRRCLERLKEHKKVNHPYSGMQVTNLYGMKLKKLEALYRKLPRMSGGVLVQMVEEGSPASCAGICAEDIIVQCNGTIIRTPLELFEILWDITQKSIDIVVERASMSDSLKLSMSAEEATANNFNRWPIQLNLDLV